LNRGGLWLDCLGYLLKQIGWFRVFHEAKINLVLIFSNLFSFLFAFQFYCFTFVPMNEIPKRFEKKKGAPNVYGFDSLEVGVENGRHITCRQVDRDRQWASLRALCSNYSRSLSGVFKCYPTETGVFYYREQ